MTLSVVHIRIRRIYDSYIMHWKGCERKWSWPNLSYPIICMERLRKNKTVSGPAGFFCFAIMFTPVMGPTEPPTGASLAGVSSCYIKVTAH
jgi:hypothetical protein